MRRVGWSRRGVVSLLPLGALVTLALVAGAGANRGPARVWIPIAPVALGLGADLLPLVTPEATVRRIAGVFRRDLNLPLPDAVVLRLYASPALLESGLVHHAGVAPALAATVSEFAAGVSFEHQLFLLEPESRRGAREWTRLVAHEMAHLSQFELTRGEGLASQWLAEGAADWTAYAVLERLGLPKGLVAAPAGANAIGLALAAEAAIDLHALAEPRAFFEYAHQRGAVSTYRLAYLLADRLIERHGLPRMVAYFRAFATTRDREDNFRHAFGQSVSEFERDVLAQEAQR